MVKRIYIRGLNVNSHIGYNMKEQNKPHKHAESMASYAKDAAETDKPWERWLTKALNGGQWARCRTHPTWRNNAEYKRDYYEKLTVIVNGISVPLRGFETFDYNSDDGISYLLISKEIGQQEPLAIVDIYNQSSKSFERTSIMTANSNNKIKITHYAKLELK